MASFISGIPSSSFDYATDRTQPTADGAAAGQTAAPEETKLTANQQMHQLKAAGQSPAEIAASLGVAQSQVLLTLGIAFSPPSAAAPASILSIKE